MLAINILLIIFLSVATAFRVPEGTQDGFYKAYINEDGVEVHEKDPVMVPANLTEIAAVNAAILKRNSVRGAGRVARRGKDDYWDTKCGCG